MNEDVVDGTVRVDGRHARHGHLQVKFKTATSGEVQAAIRAFLDIPLPMPEFVDGQFVMPPAKGVTPEFLAGGLGCDLVRANALMVELVVEGYVDDEGRPLATAMALAHNKALPRMSWLDPLKLAL